MATVVELVNSSDTWGGLRDGYRRSQVGFPTGTVGQPPAFRGVNVDPGKEVKAPRILASAARNNAGTNVCVPYARVCPADELANKGRLDQGDIAFISRYRIGEGPELRMNAIQRNHHQDRQITTSVSHPHADVCRLVGLDWINRALGPGNYKAGKTALVNNFNVADAWRSLTFLNEWTLDGIVLSNDSPGFVMSTTADARNDQLFNIGIQGPVQCNNGFEDDSGRGIAAQHDRATSLAAGRMPMRIPEGMSRKNLPQPGTGTVADVRSLIAGPFYHQYPLQMFDRKIKPMSDLYVGLVSRTYARDVDEPELDKFLGENPNLTKGTKWEGKTVDTVTVFQYILFSSRQAHQFTPERDAAGNPTGKLDKDVVDTSSRGESNETDPNLGEAEPASRRRGFLDHKRKRDDSYMPRAEDTSGNAFNNDSFLGIKKIELEAMVGAWRLGSVLDVASQRKEGYTGGPIDTAFRVTLNLDLSFMDWRALRRKLNLGFVGKFAGASTLNQEWLTYDFANNKFVLDDGAIMQWPTMYTLYDTQPATGEEDDNIPYNPAGLYDTIDDRTGQIEWWGSMSKDKRFVPRRDVNQQKNDYYNLFTSTIFGDSRDPTAYPDAPIFAPAAGSSSVETMEVEPSLSKGAARATVASATSASVEPTPVATAPVAAPVAPRAAATASAPAAEPQAPTPTPTAARLGTLAFPEVSDEPAAKKARDAPRRPAVGEDVMASIFGGGSSAPSSSSCTSQQSSDPSSGSASAPKSFPRRNRKE